MSDMHPACARCRGACCEQLVIPLPLAARPDEIKWLGMRGEIRNMHLRVNAPCVNLSASGKCEIHDDRPHPCRIYPVGGEACRAAIANRRSTIAEEILAKLEG
jgi:Fe-S-cluster containining protein